MRYELHPKNEPNSKEYEQKSNLGISNLPSKRIPFVNVIYAWHLPWWRFAQRRQNLMPMIEQVSFHIPSLSFWKAEISLGLPGKNEEC
jgi:hypothetical protein